MNPLALSTKKAQKQSSNREQCTPLGPRHPDCGLQLLFPTKGTKTPQLQFWVRASTKYWTEEAIKDSSIIPKGFRSQHEKVPADQRWRKNLSNNKNNNCHGLKNIKCI